MTRLEGNQCGCQTMEGAAIIHFFEGSHPVGEATAIDSSIPLLEKLNWLFCDVEQGQCSKQVDIVLRLGNRDLAVQTVAVPDEDNFYAFEFFVNDDEIPEGEAFGVRLTFQKLQSLLGGYTLYLGNGNAYMDIPVLPPYVPTVPGLGGEEYVSPYEQASGYTLADSNSTSFLGLIFLGTLESVSSLRDSHLFHPSPCENLRFCLPVLDCWSRCLWLQSLLGRWNWRR